MKFIADLHIHSKYSRATSPESDLEHLSQWARIKGVDVVGTGDFTHPLWLQNLKEKLIPAEPGLYKLKFQPSSKTPAPSSKANLSQMENFEKEIRFLLTTEISCIYSKKGRVRKIHILVFAPDFQTVEKINTHLSWIGNLAADGRPILGLDAKELVKIVLSISEDCLIVPAHMYTPWFSLFGSRSGFDSLEECFEDYSKYIYAGETGLSCYDEKTEVLTNNGWKKFSEVRKSDEICTLNLKNYEIEFQKPIGIFAYDYKGKMYRLKTKRVDLLVTPNHKLLVSKCNFRKPPHFFLKEAQFLFGKSKQFKKDGVWIGKNPKYFILPAVKMNWGCQYFSGGSRIKSAKKIPIKPWLKFFGFWLAEGWTNEDKKGHAYNVCLSNRNNALLSEMKRILESFGYDVYWERKINNTIRVRDYQLFHYLRQFGKCYNKFIPSEIKSLSKELLEIFLEYYIKGDGHVYGRTGKGLCASTSSIHLRDDLQEIALKMGISAYYKLDKKRGTIFRSPAYKYKKVYKQRNDTWLIYFIRHNRHTVLPSTIKKYNHIESWVNFNGKVFSLAVPNQVIYVRRNGIPVWCGNSDPPMSWRNSSLDRITLISNSDAHSPAHLAREANVFDTELSYQGIVEAIKSKDPRKFLYTIEFYPQEGKYHYDGHRNCNISLSPAETRKYNGICPVCGKPLTVGVLNRVEQLSDRPQGFKPKDAVPYKSLVPLKEIMAEVLNIGAASKRVEKEYQHLIESIGPELKILLDASRSELEAVTLPEIVEGILRVREGRVKVEPGYDGVYGKIRIFSPAEKKEVNHQKTLF